MSTTHFGPGRAAVVGGMGSKVSIALLAAMSMSTVMLPAPSSQAQPAPSAYYGEQGRAQTNQTPATSHEKQGDRRTTSGISYGPGGGRSRNERRSGPGWTTAHVQRTARKERNRQRNKKSKRR